MAHILAKTNFWRFFIFKSIFRPFLKKNDFFLFWPIRHSFISMYSGNGYAVGNRVKRPPFIKRQQLNHQKMRSFQIALNVGCSYK